MLTHPDEEPRPTLPGAQEPPLPIGDVTGFHPTERPGYQEAITSTIDSFVASAKTYDWLALHDMLNAARDRRHDTDIAFIEALERHGCILTINHFVPDNRVVVSLPSRFEDVFRERQRRREDRKKAMDVAHVSAPHPYIGKNLCSEIIVP